MRVQYRRNLLLLAERTEWKTCRYDFHTRRRLQLWQWISK